MKGWITSIVLIVITATLGCISQQETPMTAVDIKDRAVHSCENVNTYTFTLSMNDTLAWPSDKDTITINVSIKGDGEVDLAHKKAKSEGTFSFFEPVKFESYIIDDILYMKEKSQGDDQWTKRNLSDADESWGFGYLEKQKELLKISRVERLEDEAVNGVDCYVLSIQPDPQKYVEIWAEQATQIGYPQEFSKCLCFLYAETVSHLWSVKYWIAKETYLLMKAYNRFTLDESYYQIIDRLSEPPYTFYFPKVYRGVEYSVSYGYNVEVDIELPKETKNASWETSETSFFLFNYSSSRSRRIDGFVYNISGKPVYYAEVNVFSSGCRYDTFTDENGYFSADIFPVEKAVVKVSMHNVSITREIAVEQNMSPVEISLPITKVPTGRICGYITDFALNPIEGVQVYEKVRNLSAVTDENGYYCFKDIIPGEIIFSFSAKGYDTWRVGEKKTILLPGVAEKFQNLSFPTVGFDQGGINGVIIDSATRRPVEGAKVMILVDGEVISILTNENGYYEFENLGSWVKYPLIAFKKGYCLVDTFAEVSSNIITRVDLEFNPSESGAYLAGFITSETGYPIPIACVEITHKSGYSCNIAYNGVYSLGPLNLKQPDKFHIKILAVGYQTLEEDISIPPGRFLIKHYTLIKNLKNS
jgi:hypothetical protein